MVNEMSINRKKVHISKSVNGLLMENLRTAENAKYYDKDGRNIDTSKTSENVILSVSQKLIDNKLNIDKSRDELKAYVDDMRKKQSDDDIQLEDFEEAENPDGSPKYKNAQRAFLSAKANRHKRTSSNAVDLVTSVVQFPPDLVGVYDKDKQIRFFKRALEYMNANIDTYGTTLSAVIHFDETTPHMQVISSTINQSDHDINFNAKAMFGNKTKMSNDQSAFVDYVREEFPEVQRGIKRIDNPKYKNYADEVKINTGKYPNRYNDKAFTEIEEEQQKTKQTTQKTKEEIVDVLTKISPKLHYTKNGKRTSENIDTPKGRATWLKSSISSLSQSLIRQMKIQSERLQKEKDDWNSEENKKARDDWNNPDNVQARTDWNDETKTKKRNETLAKIKDWDDNKENREYITARYNSVRPVINLLVNTDFLNRTNRQRMMMMLINNGGDMGDFIGGKHKGEKITVQSVIQSQLERDVEEMGPNKTVQKIADNIKSVTPKPKRHKQDDGPDL